MLDLLKDLNKEQKQAVSHKNGPLLIIAGAGTGKTLVITRRIANIISKKWAKPAEILALTFTDKAATEMEERVDKLVPYGFVDTQISTFHAFGDRLLRDYAIDLGLPANFKILSTAEQAIFMRENLYSFDLKYYRPISNPISHIEELIKYFSRLKDELISPDKYIRFAHNGIKGKVKSEKGEDKEEVERHLELANAYKRYQELMIQEGNLDYGDQIFLAYKLLKENKKVLKEVQEKFKYILVDEFQDTNFAQYELVKLISKTNKNITVVGDDDQSIYRFRGASISNILSFKSDHPACRQIVLNQNYRSTQEILDSAYKLIRHNDPDRLEVKNKINKRLKAQKHGPLPQLLSTETLSDEADLVVKKIIDLKKEKKLQNKDFAVLTRANSHLDPFIQALSYKKISFAFAGTSSLFLQSEIKMIVAFFKCITYEDDNLSFYHLARSEIYNVDDSTLSKYYAKTKRENKSFFELFENSKDKKIQLLLANIKHFREQSVKNSAGEILFEFLKEKGIFKRLVSLGTVEAQVKITNIAKFFERISQFDRTSHDKSVLAFLENLELIMSVSDEISASDIDPDLDAVNLMTAHSAKGLEWPVVFVSNMVSERFPSRNQREAISIPDELIKERLPKGDYHLQEERRLFYVAATRAKDYLFLSWAIDYGGKRAKKLSPFVLELLDDPNIAKSRHKLSAIEKMKRFDLVKQSAHKKSTNRNSLMRLSRQQIDDYFTCPKKYYFSNIIRIPLPTSWHFMYGTAIHEAVGRYHARKMSGEKPDLQSMISDFEQSFVSEGFITREQEQERKRKGLETLAKFFNEDQKNKFIPDAVEENFEFRAGNVLVRGRYDLVVKGEGGEVLDFKTSEVDSQKDADSRASKSTQMKMYALAWQSKYNAICKTTLIFIESDLKATKKFSQKDLDKTQKMIENVAEGIKKEDFKAKPNPFQCRNCPYKNICPNSLS